MWAGPRGGAPFTAACLRLLDMAADSEVSLPVEGVLDATVRQMAHEVLNPMRGFAHSARHVLREAAKMGPLYPQYFEPDSGTPTAPI